MFNYYQRLQKLPADRFLKTVLHTDSELYTSGGKSWFGCLANFSKQEKLSDLDTYSKDSFLSEIENIYNEKISNHIGKLKGNKDSKLQIFGEGFTEFCQTKYVSFNIRKNKRSLFTKFRFSSHNFMIETGRYRRPKIERNERFCPFCPNKVESKVHFLLHCHKYVNVRETYLKIK